MSACRNSRALAAAMLAALCAEPAAAQIGPPVNLLPAPRQAPAAPSPGATPAAEQRPTRPAPGGIEVRALPAHDPAAVGTLGPAEGGFGADLWAGAERLIVEKLLARLPMGAPSHAMTALARRLLLSGAPPPPGPAQADWLALSLDRLAAGGLLSDLDAMLALAPAGTESALVRLRVQSDLLAGRTDKACARAPALLESDPGVGAMKLMAFCRQLAGDRGQVELYEGMLREAGDKDPLFAKLMAALERPNAPAPDAFAGAGPLHLAMLRTAGRKLPADAGEAAGPLVRRAVAAEENAPMKARIAAAERAEAAGAISTETLRAVYMAATDAEGYAAAYQAAQREPLPALRAKAIAEALRAARDGGGYMTQARVHAPALRDIEPRPELAWFAADAGRALAAAGELRRAFGWLAAAQRAASPANPEAAVAVVMLWPLLAVADERRPLPVTPEILARWREAHDPAHPAFAERAGLLYAVLEALGESVPDAEWSALAAGPLVEPAPAPTALVARGLARAGDQSLGETVLFALIALGEHGPAGAAPATVAGAVGALAKAGLQKEARAIALEAMIARGF